MATLDDILTAQKNGVVAINALNQTWISYKNREFADQSSKCLSENTLITTGSGFICTVIVIDAGTETGLIYDFASADRAEDSARRFTIPKDPGVYRVDCQFFKGILVSPGADQSVVVTYTLD